MVVHRPSVAPTRKLLAAALGTIAAFIMLFGAGMESWAIVALGTALLVLAVSLTLVNAVRPGARAWVAGTAQVLSASERPPIDVEYGRCELQIVVAAPGLSTSSVWIRDPRVPVAKWPEPTANLPVIVAVDDMRHVRIRWDEVMTHEQAELADRKAFSDASDDHTLRPGPLPGGRRRPSPRPTGASDDQLPDAAEAAPTLPPSAATASAGPAETADATVGNPVDATGTDFDATPTTHDATAPADTAAPADEAAADTAAPADEAAADEAADARIDGLITAYPSARPGPSGAIHGVGLTVPVSDLDQSRNFYRDLLGFYEIDTGPGNAVLASGDTRLVLREIPEVPATKERQVHLNLEVGDVQAVHADLRQRGATFAHDPRPVTRGGRLELWAAALQDPDGHSVDITEWRMVG